MSRRGSPAGFDAVVSSPVGPLGIAIEAGALTRIALLPPDTPETMTLHPLARETAAQLARYFEDPGWRFDLPTAELGTPFRRRVWRALRDIPGGTTRSYGALADELATSPRAVGGACRANPLLLVTPCHRVTGAGGDPGGFAGAAGGHPLRVKQWLLAHEAMLR
ncbi:MAG: methylated-DNA--[protein]-cysteine S-methyltransferase [Gammaproteobacteria bacterium]|nr:methylated-DNA--[protein]-cysteine S-methyltransferase [Gammaproteobacteria bacterium]